MFEILQIKQMKGFHCTGKDCIDTCCHTWSININKSTYKKYKKNKDIDMNNFKIIDKHDSSRYASIKLNSEGYCPFLCTDGLCDIHKKYGDKYLGEVCKMYPKQIIKFNNFIEKTFLLSCPSAVDMLFSSNEPLEFDLDENPNKVTYITGQKDVTDSEILNADSYFLFRSISISILQNRKVTLEKRLYRLAKLCDIVQNLIESGYKDTEIEAFLLEIKDSSGEEEYLNKEEIRQNNIEGKYEVIQKLLKLFDEMLIKGICKNKNGFGKYIDNRLSEIDSISLGSIKYFNENILNNYFKENEFILENYLVYNVFQNVFPKGRKNLTTVYKEIINNLFIMQLFIIMLYTDNTKLELEQIKNAIYFYERQIHHSEINKLLLNNLNTSLKLDWMTSIDMIF